MIQAIVNNQNPVAEIVPILVLLAVIAVCVTVFMIVTWNVEPWTRKYLKPHKQLRADRYRVKIWRLKSQYPEAFKGADPFVQYQHFRLIDELEENNETQNKREEVSDGS